MITGTPGPQEQAGLQEKAGTRVPGSGVTGPRVVATFTTLPDRYSILTQSLKSLKEQTHPPDAIYLALPLIAQRLQKEYPPLPMDVEKMVTVVRSPVDYGPLTKIYGALMSEHDPATIIISCDDDIIYPKDLVEKLVAHAQAEPQSTICATGALLCHHNLLFSSIYSTLKHAYKWNAIIGFSVPPTGRNIDLVFGVAGVLYRRGFFPATGPGLTELTAPGPTGLSPVLKFFELALQDRDIFCNDDMLISAYLAQQKIKRKIFPDLPLIDPRNGSADSLSGDLMVMVPRATRAFAALRKRGFFTVEEMEPLDLNETPAFRIFLLVLIFIFAIIVFYLMYLQNK